MKKLLTLLLFQSLFIVSLPAQEIENEFGYNVMPDVTSSSTDPVGSPAGSFSVSPIGAAVYSVPIEVPKGIQGTEPQISITYNSQSGNGIAGFGCNITGFSVITRGARDIYHDGHAETITFTNADAFYLDGQRLVYIDELSTADTLRYFPESDPYTVVSLCNADSSTRWFKVEANDGMVYEYKYRLANGSYGILAWYLTKSTTPVGNSITYDYTESNKHVMPSTVYYSDSINKMSFQYESRPDTTLYAIAKGQAKMVKRLRHIYSYTRVNGTYQLFRTYALTYNATGDQTTCKYSRLTKITLSNADGEDMKPVILSWSYLPTYLCEKVTPTFDIDIHDFGASSESMSFFAGDLNGDGLSDLAEMARTSGLGSSDFNFLKIYHAQKDNNGEICFQHVINTELPSYMYINSEWKSIYTSPVAYDADHDGINELAVPIYGNFGNEIKFFGFNLYKDGIFVVSLRSNDIHVSNMEGILWSMADLNNDGKTETIAVEKATASTNHYYGFSLGGYTSENAFCKSMRFILPAEPKYLFTSDMNNDGLADVIIFYNNGYRVFWNDGTWLDNLNTTCTPAYTNYTLNRAPSKVWQGDFNGDGICDYLISSTNDSNLYFELGNGIGGLIESVAATTNAFEQSTDEDDDLFVCHILDFDGDGKSDVFISKAKFILGNVFSKTYSYWLKSDGKHLVQQKAATSNKMSDAKPQYYVTGDFDGNGLAELSSLSYDCYNGNNANENPVFRIYRNGNIQNSSGKVTIATNGFGSRSQIQYKPMTDSCVYTKGDNNDLSFPVLTITPSMQAVSTVMTDDGAAGTLTTNYTYEGLKVHFQGKGLLGMTATNIENQNTGLTVENRITEWNEDILQPSETVETQRLGSLTSSKTTSYYGHYLWGTPSFTNRPYLCVSHDFDGNVIREGYLYSEYNGGALESYTREYNGNMKEETYCQDFHKRGGIYLPDTVFVLKRCNSEYHQDTLSYVYDSKGQVLTKKRNSGTNLTLTTAYTYDSYGNPLSVTTSGNGVEDVATTYQYDTASHRFMTKSIERGYIEKEYTYDAWGNVLTMTDKTHPSYPLTTTYMYDGWGNLISDSLSTGQKTTYIQGWGSSAAKKYFTLRQGTAHPWLLTWYDQSGREVGSETIGAKDLSYVTAMTYNTKGLLDTKTLTTKIPNSSTSTVLQQSYTYDDRGRVLTDTYDGTVTSYSYNGNTTSVTKAGRTVSTTYDALGNPLSVTDPSGTVTYQYGANWKPKSVTAHGSTVTMEYDEAGNQTKLVDPDAGTQRYTYDAYGRIVTQRDGRGITTTNTYNQFGQLTLSTTGAVTTTYTYGQNSDNQGLLLSSSRQNNSISYTYDQYGRVRTETRSLSNVGNRQFSYTYDSKGQLSSIGYPGNITATYDYDSYGNKVNVYVGGTRVWNYNYHSPTMSSYWLGTSVFRTVFNDKRGRTTNVRFGTSPTGTDFGSLSYTYDDATDNMTSRTGMFTEQEAFTYDNLDRLTGIQYGNQTQHTVSYAPNGNITMQTSIGRYFYESNKPHAVTGVENLDMTIPLTPLRTVYNPFGRIETMAEDGTGYTMIVSYGPDNERWESQLSHGDTLKRTIRYFGDYEEIVENGTTRKLYYLDDNVLYVKQTGQADKIYFLMTDHLGSVVKILDESRTTKFAATYDAWGNQTVTQNDIGFHRGYTGHEMLPEFGLINMNGRLYDPVIGRFLSTDNYVQQPANSQNFNRYSYCLNNPLKFTDPDGESFSLLFGIVISSMLNWYSNGCETNMKGFVHAAIGAGIGVASFYSGQFISTSLSAIGILPGATVGAIAGSAIGSISSIMSNGLNNIVNGSSFTSNMASNALSGAISGAVSGAISGGIKGFKNAKKVDANVWTGNKIIKEQTIATSIKDILPQEDASKWCYAVAGEYADLGHGNRNRDDFLCVSDYADGFDFQRAAKKVGMDVISYSKLSAKEYEQLEYYFKTKKYEVVLSIGKDVNNGHAVNLVSYDIQTKLNVLGGGVHQIVRNMKVWDPIFGKVTDLNDKILKVQIVRY